MSDSEHNSLSAIDAIVGSFRRDWRAGSGPIEECLEAHPELAADDLFRAFLAAELHERRLLGEDPTPDEYRQRFGRFADAVAEGFEDTRDSLADSSRGQERRRKDDFESNSPRVLAMESLSSRKRTRVIQPLGSGRLEAFISQRISSSIAKWRLRWGILGASHRQSAMPM